MPPVKTQDKAKKKSTSPAKVSKHKNELTTLKSQKLKKDYKEKKKKKLESEVIKQKKKILLSDDTKQKKKKKSESEVIKQKKKKILQSEVEKQKKKKILQSEFKKQKKKKMVKFPSRSVKAAKPKQKKVVNKKNQKNPTKSLAKKQNIKSPDLKSKITISKRKRQNSESEVQVKIKKKRKIHHCNSSQIIKPKEPVKVKKMPQTETEEVSLKMDEMGTANQKCVTCFSCNLLVPEKDFHSHLFFGSIKCRFCLYSVQTCTDFANQMLKPDSYCPKSPMKMHGILQWDSCLHYVLLCVEREITIRNFCNKIKTKPNEFELCCEISKYINSLESLEQIEPWKSAFLELKAHCEQVLSQLKPKNCYPLKLFKGNERKSDGKFIAESKLCSENKLIIRTKDLDKHISSEASEDLVVPEKKVHSQQNQGTECAIVSELCSSNVYANITGISDSNKTESNEMENIKQEEDLIKGRKHHPKFKKRDLKKIVSLPRDDRYLLVNYPNEQCPEECPECYSGFYPSNMTLFCTTGITKVVCEVCGLVIFIVPDFL